MASAVTWQSSPPEKLLQERFRITTGFHPGQREIIEQLVQGKRVLAIQRTAWGKSLCYQMVSLYYPHLTIVFSPLKALMRDQCQRCNTAYGIPSAIVSSDFSEEENRAILKQAIAGKFKILFIAPERLDNALWQTYVPQMRISMIVIDEAHCISTWGHDFRPSYRRIVNLLSALPKNIPVLALTATANKRVEADILQQIGAETQVVRGTMQRPNLYLNVVRVSGDWSKLCYLAEVLRHRTDTGIVYTATQSTAVMAATFLRQQGLNAEYYHADREESVRWDIEQKLMANQYNVVCSTNALGMGIDKPDIRFVVHYHVPASPIHYYQEIGRAGRDGKLAWCILLYDPADLTIQEHFMRKDRLKEENDAVHSQRRQELSDMQSYAQTDGCYVQYLTTYLGDQVGYPCGTCGHCQRENFPVITPSKGIQSGAIHFLQEGFLPYIEKCSTEDCPVHEAGWSLSYHGWSRIGNLVRASKYENAGPFALGLVYQAVELVRARYPIHTISGVISVPPTKSGLLVEMFARQVASLLNVEYLPVLTKVRPTEEQKNPTNRVQKAENVKGAFSVISPQFVADRGLLLIDDIYDSGYTLREVGQTLMQAGAKAVYPLTITRTLHSDKQ